MVKRTDSSYVTFPHLADAPAKEMWEYAEYVANEVSKLFPAPNRLLFEETIYKRFLILTKKRYMSLACGKDGKIDRKIKKKGVLLARRDNSEFVRDVYSQVILKIFDKESRDDILYFILQEFNKLCSGCVPHSKFIITQAIGDSGGLQVQPFIDAKRRKKGQIGDYKVNILPEEDGPKRDKQLKLKNATTAQEYYLRSLPAQVQLAEKMRRRGQPVEAGSRLEYVVITGPGHISKKYEKIESAEYFEKHSDILKLDYLWYLKQFTNPLDQVLNVLYNKDEPEEKYRFQKNFVLEQYKFRSKQREKLLNELNNLFQPKLKFK